MLFMYNVYISFLPIICGIFAKNVPVWLTLKTFYQKYDK